MQHITITTDFDVTRTGIVRHFKKEALPFSSAGHIITSESEWVLLRRQQTNWETVVQIISLRAQPINMRCTKKGKKWQIEFDVEREGVYKNTNDPIGLLKEDCNNVPMLTNLTETKKLKQSIVLDSNMWFSHYEL